MTEWHQTQRLAADGKHEIAISERMLPPAGKGVLSTRSRQQEIRAAVYRKGQQGQPLFTVTTRRPPESRIVGVRDVEWEALRRLGSADFTEGADYST